MNTARTLPGAWHRTAEGGRGNLGTALPRPKGILSTRYTCSLCMFCIPEKKKTSEIETGVTIIFGIANYHKPVAFRQRRVARCTLHSIVGDYVRL